MSSKQMPKPEFEPAFPVYVEGIAAYAPCGRMDNDHLAHLCGVEPDWFLKRTGIVSRSRAGAGESTNGMALKAVDLLLGEDDIDLGATDLIIGATYTPSDTIVTPAHAVQRHLGIDRARALLVSTACSSFLSAVELAQLYFSAGKARSALIVASEHNSQYADDLDRTSGHLWGDAAAAIHVCAHTTESTRFEVLDVQTHGRATVGQGPAAIYLDPANDGLIMPHGRDVFTSAAQYMAEDVQQLLDRNNLGTGDIELIVPHQANGRIIDRVCSNLGIAPERCAMSYREYGNTGSASVPLSLTTTTRKLGSGDYVALVTFGGGYSSGASLWRVCGGAKEQH